MTSKSDLKNAVEAALEEKGLLEEMKCRIRSEIVATLNESGSGRQTQRGLPMSATPENFLINELIKEYLEFNDLHHTKDMLLTESGHPKLSMERGEMEKSLKVSSSANAQEVPLLYSILSTVKSLTK
eukprot:TCALIF_02393-PA protein Name:"Similar to FOPNL LisH domain-containing protein FOPNL (Gallus gallus)" AED:0.40 eAED:0.40 QI:0/-1/0/1/-1/1/1/0/126